MWLLWKPSQEPGKICALKPLVLFRQAKASLKCALWVQQHLAGPQLGPNGGLITHSLLTSTGAVVPPAIWMLLPYCLSFILQWRRECEENKRLRRGKWKSEGVDNYPETNVHAVIIFEFDSMTKQVLDHMRCSSCWRPLLQNQISKQNEGLGLGFSFHCHNVKFGIDILRSNTTQKHHTFAKISYSFFINRI